MPAKPADAKPRPPAGLEENLSFEEAMSALEAVVNEMAAGDMPLEKLVSSHERAVMLVKLCEGRLAEARERIQLIETGAGGAATLRPFDPAEAAAQSGE